MKRPIPADSEQLTVGCIRLYRHFYDGDILTVVVHDAEGNKQYYIRAGALEEHLFDLINKGALICDE